MAAAAARGGARGVVFGDEKRTDASTAIGGSGSILRSTGASIMNSSIISSPPQSPGQGVRRPTSSGAATITAIGGVGSNMSSGGGGNGVVATGGTATSEPQPVGGVRARHAPRVLQKWKINDQLAQKNGACQAVYWVRQRQQSASGAIGHLARRSGEKVDLQREMKTSAADKKQWVTGTVYKGEWKANLKHGFGTQIWANGNKYEGEWERGMRHGHGDLWIKRAGQEALERIYTGNWKNDLKDGLGVFTYSDGSRYEGNWQNGLRHGQGTLYYPNGNEYVGEWRDGWQNGYGRLTYANEDVYEGDWLNGKREGAGIFYYKSKEKIYDGEWVNDIAKCGVYTDAKEFFDNNAARPEALAAASAHSTDPLARFKRPLPVLRLADADALLVERIEEIQKQRQAVRNMPFMPLEDLFDDAAIDDLRRIFASADSEGNGSMPVSSLREVLAELQFSISDEELAQVLLDLRKKPSSTLNFSEFVKAAHLVDDMKSSTTNGTSSSLLASSLLATSIANSNIPLPSSSTAAATSPINSPTATSVGIQISSPNDATAEAAAATAAGSTGATSGATSPPASSSIHLSASANVLSAADLSNASSPAVRSPMPDRPSHPTPAAASGVHKSNTSFEASIASPVVPRTSLNTIPDTP